MHFKPAEDKTGLSVRPLAYTETGFDEFPCCDILVITGSYTNDNLTNSFGLKVDVTQFKVGFEFSSIVSDGQNLSVSDYTNVSISGYVIIVALVVLATGQAPDPSFTTSPVPAFG